MPNVASAIASQGREDISQFIVHLTRDDRATHPNGGKTARDNFRAIVSNHIIGAYRPHCIFNDKLHALPRVQRQRFYVSCFTEVPLNQIHRLVGEIKGRSIKLEAYGLVFTKEFIISKGGQPALYINQYGGNKWLRESVDALYEYAREHNEWREPVWRMLPFINAMHERYDFTWEREWRVCDDVGFLTKDIVCAILPPEGEEEIREKFARFGIAVISPSWHYEQIVNELAKQQRATRKVWRDKVVESATPKPEGGA